MAVPTEDFESGTAGSDINGGSGGTGWSNNWTANAEYDYSNATPYAGSLFMRATLDGNNATRDFTGISTDNAVFEIAVRDDSTTKRVVTRVTDGGVVNNVIVITFSTGGQIQALNNITNDNIQAYNANQWYLIDAKVTSFSGKTWQIQVDGGGYSANKTFGNNTGTQATTWAFQSNDTHNQDWDAIGGSLPTTATTRLPYFNLLGVGG